MTTLKEEVAALPKEWLIADIQHQGLRHRGMVIEQVLFRNIFQLMSVNNIQVNVVKMQNLVGWFIIPKIYQNDLAMDDIGPFATAADAIVYLRLIMD